MPRRARIIIPEIPVHIIQRGNNRQNCFYKSRDYRLYLNWLRNYAALSECRVHAYVLMMNHVHMLLTPSHADSIGFLMKRLGQRYVQYINRTYERTGTLWEGRYRSCLVQQDVYLMACYRYIELNPVRAGIVQDPSQYQWSSYRRNGLGETNDLISPHQLYLDLGRTDSEQRASYLSLFVDELRDEYVEEFRRATTSNCALGHENFRRDVEGASGRRLTRETSGRPALAKRN